jgi:hypothetical protein
VIGIKLIKLSKMPPTKIVPGFMLTCIGKKETSAMLVIGIDGQVNPLIKAV